MGIMTYSSDITKIRTYKSKNNGIEVHFAAILTDKPLFVYHQTIE